MVHACRIPPELRRRAEELGEEGYAAEVEELRTRIQSAIESDLGEVPGGCKPSVHVLLKRPARAIQETVEHLHPDVLVMGSISRGGVPGFDVGTTAERLLDRVDCSMLVLKPEDFLCPVAASG